MSLFNTYNTDGSVKKDHTIATGLVTLVAAPFDHDKETLVTAQNRAITTIAWSAVAFLAGEAYGQKRAREGNEAIVPFLRGA